MSSRTVMKHLGRRTFTVLVPDRRTVQYEDAGAPKQVIVSLVVCEVDRLDWTGVSRPFSGACILCIFQFALHCCP